MLSQESNVRTVDPILLYLVIGLIAIVKIAMAFCFDVAYFFNPLTRETYLYIQYLSSVLCFVFLYYYTVTIKKQKLFFAVIAVIVIVKLYAVGFSIVWSFIDPFFSYEEYDEDKLRLMYLMQEIPGYLSTIMELVLAVQLFKNKIEGAIGYAMRYLSIAFLIKVGVAILYATPLLIFADKANMLLVAYRILDFICMLPYMGMLYLYCLELKAQTV